MKKKSLKRKKNNNFFGDIFSEYSSSYVSDDISNKEMIQQYINVTAIAWNLSILKGEKRKFGINKFISDYVINNPIAPEWDVQVLKNDIVNLIDHKDKYYAEININIVSVEVKVVDGETRLVVVSMQVD